MTDDPALFDLPSQPRPVGPSRVERGQTRGTYERTVVADIRVVDSRALCASAVHAFDSAPTITFTWDDEEDPADGGDERDAAERDLLTRDPGAALSWLIEPVDSHLPLDEAGAARTYATRIEIDDTTGAGLRVRWTVELMVRDVAAFRKVALDASPDADPVEIANSIATAWNHAVDPYAPLQEIPGITWTPVNVDIEHVPAKLRRTARHANASDGSDPSAGRTSTAISPQDADDGPGRE